MVAYYLRCAHILLYTVWDVLTFYFILSEMCSHSTLYCLRCAHILLYTVWDVLTFYCILSEMCSHSTLYCLRCAHILLYTVWDVLTFYFIHCIIRLKIIKINNYDISQKCSIHNTGRKGILLPDGEVPRHIRQEDETVVILPPLHEWTPCEGRCNCSCSRVRLSKQGAIFEPVVSHLICSCDASDQWDTTGEEFCQSGITLFPCRNYLSVASLMYQICFIHLCLIPIICDCNKCVFMYGKSTNIDQLRDAGRTRE